MPVLLPLLIAGGGAIAGVAGGAIGDAVSAGDRDAAAKAQKEALERLYGINLPNITKEELDLIVPQLAGTLTTEQESAIAQGDTNYNKISVDPRLKQAQMSALSKLQQVGEEGLTAEDVAALNDARRTMAREATARDASILQNMAQRGMGGSGQELAARMMASQGSAERGSMEADNQAATAQARALQAMKDSGSLGGQIRTQEFGEQESVARARDAINQFNTQNQRDVQRGNIDRNVQVDQFNLNNRQNINNATADIKNREQAHNKGLQGEQYRREVELASLKAGADRAKADSATAEAERKAKFWNGLGGGVANAAGSVAGGLLPKK
jgi:hypothetical protein